jgi:D-3-phosphoglycerate dehydrogenase
MPTVLIADKMSARAVEIFHERGIAVEVKTGLGKEALCAIIGQYDGLAIRSATNVDADVLAAASRLKVVGRAGIGVDNVDIHAASKRGVIVMNTPYGNTVTTAEHAIALMMAAARMIPQATMSLKAGQWEKSRFQGVELYQKTLGVIGTGNIGSLVIARAQGLGMRIIAYDPYLSKIRATDLGVELVEMDTLLARADFLTVHTPLTDATRNLFRAETFAKMKPGAILVNAARGCIVDEAALYDALKSGHLRAAALDVFCKEPVHGDNPLLELDNFICTPHLGASTEEAQVNVAIQVAEQISAYLLRGVVQNAVNLPSVREEELPLLQPYLNLGERLGLVLGQLAGSGLREVVIEYAGEVAELNTAALTTAILKGILQSSLPETINAVNAPVLAKERGIGIETRKRESADELRARIAVTLRMDQGERVAVGTLVHEHQARLVQLDGIDVEMPLAGDLLYIQNRDEPGLIGRIGGLLGAAGINIAQFHLGREKPAGAALSFIAVDQPLTAVLLEQVAALPGVLAARMLRL